MPPLLAKAPRAGASQAAQAEFLRRKLRAENLYPLLWNSQHMNIRAVIFDVYGTLLEVGPAAADADTRWQHLCREMLHMRAAPQPPRFLRRGEQSD